MQDLRSGPTFNMRYAEVSLTGRITFKNTGTNTLNILVYYGSAAGSCVSKPQRRNFTLPGGESEPGDYGEHMVCYATTPDGQGAPPEGQIDGQAWPGDTINLP